LCEYAGCCFCCRSRCPPPSSILCCFVLTTLPRINSQDWDITFKALGLNYKQVNKFWRVFYKINKSGDGEVSLIEFMNYFDLERTTYVEKAFSYCDTVGGGEMDFLEFVVSIVNFCR